MTDPTGLPADAWRGIRMWTNQWLEVPIEPRRRAELQWPMAPTRAAVWAIVSARLRELFPMPDPGFDLASWFGDLAPVDPLAPVRRELQAWLDERCDPPSATESPWIALMRATECEERQRAIQAALR